MSDGLGLVLPGAGGDQFDDFVEIVPLLGASSSAWAATNRAVFVRFRLKRARPLSRVTVIVASGSGNGVGGLYTFDGTTYTKLSDSGSQAIGAISNAKFDFTFTAQDGQPFVDYAAAVLFDNTTITLYRFGLGSGAVALVNNRYTAKDVGSTSLPATQTVAALTGGASLIPTIYVS